MKRLITGTGALVLLAALLVGAPLALASWWGNPWPAGGWSEIRLLTSDTVVGAIVALGWFAWAQMTVCILIEAVSAIRHGADYLAGATAPRVRLAAPGQQELARLLVASVAALGIGATAVVTTGGAAIYSSTTTTAPAHAETNASIHPATAAPPGVRHSGPASMVTTTTNTTAWRLAETHLGDGTHWRQILDLNRGARLHDGTTFSAGTQTIPAGSTLRLPTGANQHVGRAEPTAATEAQKTAPYTVAPGDTLWDISEDKLGDPSRYPELYEASKDTLQPGGEHLTDPDLIKPGWRITIPGARTRQPHSDDYKNSSQAEKPTADTGPDPVPEAGRTSQTMPTEEPTLQGETTPPAPAETAPDAVNSPKADGHDEEEITDQDNLLTAPWALAGLTGAGVLLASGLLLGLRQRRRAQFRNRHPGRTIAAGGPELAPAEKTITASGALGEAALEYLDSALRRLAGAAHANRSVMPAVAAVEIDITRNDTGRLTLHLSEPGDLPDPWQPTPDRLHWHISTSLPVDDLGPISAEADPPYPLLVTIGQADTGELWLLNCEDLGILTLAGDLGRCRDFARHLVAQLAVNPWSEAVTVDCVGIAAEAQPLGTAIRYHTAPADAADAVDDTLAAAVAMIDRATGHDTDVATARTGQADDDLWPSRLLILDTESAESEHLGALLELVDTHVGHSATAIVLIGHQPHTPGTSLQVTAEGRVVLEQAGLDLVAVGLTTEETHGIGLIYAQSEVADDIPVPVDRTASDGPETYADQAGALRHEHTLPRDAPECHLAEPTTSLLDGDNEEYLTKAAVVPEDLDALAPKVPASIRSQVENSDPALDRDVADWFDENSPRAKISLLGPVLVRTRGKPLAKNRPFYTELAAYLWLHPNGVTRDQVVTAFGTAPDSVRKRMNPLRDWLGTNPLTGDLYLPRADRTASALANGINVYQLDKKILVDWDLFKRLRERGEARGGNEGRADLDKALELVTGRPLDRTREQGWAWLADEQRHDHYMALGIADVALTLTTQFLKDGETGRARTATEIAMLAAPDEEATRLCLVQIENADGNLAEAQRILRDDICNRSDDADAPPELSDRTKRVISDHDEWLAG